MHVLVLTLGIPNSRYGASEFVSKIAHFERKTQGYKPLIAPKLVDFDHHQKLRALKDIN